MLFPQIEPGEDLVALFTAKSAARARGAGRGGGGRVALVGEASGQLASFVARSTRESVGRGHCPARAGHADGDVGVGAGSSGRSCEGSSLGGRLELGGEGVFILEAGRFLVLDQLVVPLEHLHALFALVVEARSPLELARVGVVVRRRRLVLVHFACLLPRVLEPHDDHSGRQVEQLGQVLEIVVFGVRVRLEELLQHLNLVIGETCSIGTLAGSGTAGSW